MTVIEAFYGQNTFGQWIAISLVGMVVIGIICVISWAAEGGGDGSWWGMIWGAIVYWIGLGLLTIVLGLISLVQWLWVL